ncbi:MAG: type III pantothenate kinase [Rhodobacteraceae bacterium]|nr:type III pantothenate kinase [Paracoccaceae bacterium]
MLLGIDAGNTNTVFAVLEHGEVVRQWRCATDGARTSDEYFVWLTALMDASGLERPDDVVIACVVPNALYHLKSLCRQYFELEPLVVGSDACRLPVAARVDEGAHVGADRLVNAAAAFALYGGDLIVVDFGTATNFDVVDTDGAYVGGVIAPGVDLSVKALHEAAAALPHVGILRPSQVVGRNTRDCMHSGIFWGYLGLIKGICSDISRERGGRMQIIGTGGLAGLFGTEAGLFDHVNRDLTVFGLSVIHDFNRI